jgi:adenine specific DNA methylase Mod
MAKIEEGIETSPAQEAVAEPGRIEVTTTELVWPGKYDETGKRCEVERVSLPFQVIERVNESRATREVRAERGLTLFDVWKGDEGETFDEGWRNKLIWGDNKLVMSSLLEQFTGKVDLIYIDPPFATGADFSVEVEIGEDHYELAKEQSIIEERVYRDTWGSGLTSYLEMMRERLTLMRVLLSSTGSFFLHCDWHIGHYLKVLCDEVFGGDRFINEIAWCYTGPGSPGARQFSRKHDTIFWYAASENWKFNADTIRVAHHEKTQANFKKGLRGSGFVSETYDLAEGGKIPEDYWNIAVAARFPVDGIKRAGYATEKPWPLIERIVKATTDDGDLVADFFLGSGTLSAVAEVNGRRWIGCDLGRYAIHVSRKRLLGIEQCRPFEVLNLGKYERRYWQVATFGEDIDDDGVISVYEYVAFILKLYGATPTTGLQHLHGKLGPAFVHVGAVDAPVTINEVAACVEECAALKAGELHVLGWEWEMGMNDLVSEEAKRQGVKVVLRQIPREVMEERAAAKGDVQFFQLAYLEASVESTDTARQVTATLENFIIENPELVPDDVREKITKWSDYVDYWAVDWDFRDDTFMQGWVTYRTRKDRKLELFSDPHLYEEPGEYAVMVKVIDVFGNDTSKILRVSVS